MTSERKRAAMRAYSQTPAGQEAKRRSHKRYIEKRRERAINKLEVDVRPLAQVLTTWSLQ